MPTESQIRELLNLEKMPSQLRQAVWKADLMGVAKYIGKMKDEKSTSSSLLSDAWIRHKLSSSDKWEPIIGILIHFGAELKDSERQKLSDTEISEIDKVGEAFEESSEPTKKTKQVRNKFGENGRAGEIRPSFMEPSVQRQKYGRRRSVAVTSFEELTTEEKGALNYPMPSSGGTRCSDVNDLNGLTNYFSNMTFEKDGEGASR